MKKRRHRLLIGGLLLASLVVFTANCREATSILIEAQTNVVYRQGIVTSFTVGKPGTTENAEPTTESSTAWDQNGVIGSLVVVPETSDDASVSIKLVMGVGGRDPRECTGTSAVGCIFARRRLRYTAHEQLRLPISLYARCENVPCDAFSTCNYLGACVSAEIDPSTCETPSGCHPADDPPRLSSSASPDSGADSSSNDGSDDRGTVTPPNLDASDDRRDGSDGGGGAIPGNIDCRTTQCKYPQEHCCYNPLTQIGLCVLAGSNCPASTITITCDGKEDCGGTDTACCAVSSSYVICSSQSTCATSGTIICHSDDTCPLTNPPSACTGQVHSYYSSCVR